MSMLAPTLQAFFTDRLTRQRNASPHTIAAYRDTLRLLLAFAQKRTGKQPCQLDLDDLDAPLIGAFLDHLEHERHNSIRTRNARLAAIRSLFHYAALEHPEHAETISPHVLRHTAAMQLLHAGIDTSVIALWLGHEHVDTTQIYLHADMALKEAALARTTPPDTPPGRYQPPDKLLAFLQTL